MKQAPFGRTQRRGDSQCHALGRGADLRLWVMLFMCGPRVGAMSDPFGRRPVLIAALLAMVPDSALLTRASTIRLLPVGRIVAGFIGASHAVATACAADMTRPEDRHQAFGVIGAEFALGFVLGPALGGLAGGWFPARPGALSKPKRQRA